MLSLLVVDVVEQPLSKGTRSQRKPSQSDQVLLWGFALSRTEDLCLASLQRTFRHIRLVTSAWSHPHFLNQTPADEPYEPWGGQRAKFLSRFKIQDTRQIHTKIMHKTRQKSTSESSSWPQLLATVLMIWIDAKRHVRWNRDS